MRNMKYVTMLDPLQNKYGKELGALFYIPAFSGEVSVVMVTVPSRQVSLRCSYLGLIFNFRNISTLQLEQERCKIKLV